MYSDENGNGGFFSYHVVVLIEQRAKTGCLLYIGDYTTQLCGDYNKPL